MTVEPDTVPAVAEIVAVPALLPTAAPLLLTSLVTVATAGVADVQVTD